MRRPSRSFTVEVKRSRLRGGDASPANVPSLQQDQPQPTSAASSLSWEELLRRLPDNESSQTDQPFLNYWPGLDEEPNPPPQASSQSDASPPVSDAPSVEQPAEEKKSRILPSLLPVEIPLTKRKSAVYAQEKALWPSPRTRLPKQSSPQQTTDLRSSENQRPAQRPHVAQTAPMTADEVKALVERHLHKQSAQGSNSAVNAPMKAKPLPLENATAAPDIVTNEVLKRPLHKRRRQDFWKHRLRSYAAK